MALGCTMQGGKVYLLTLEENKDQKLRTQSEEGEVFLAPVLTSGCQEAVRHVAF